MGGKKIHIFPRDCFVCGKPMLPLNATFLECPDCEIEEDGTMKGRFYLPVAPFTWGDGDIIPFIDHSKVHLPSPDMTGG